MARRLRIEIAGGVFHVYSRGDRREAIYLDDADRKFWLALLGKVCRLHNWICHVWCQMDNHYHLILETPEKTLSKGMHQLNGVYTQAFNCRYGLVGHLFQGRFKSILVEKDSYLLELTRYVLLNPVRAAKSNSAAGWPWSSYRIMIGESPAISWLGSNWILSQFHSDQSRARKLFIDFVREGIGDSIVWENLKGGSILGSDSFASDIIRRYGDQVLLKKTQRQLKRSLVRPLGDFDSITKSTRRASMVEAYFSGGYTMAEIAEHFGVNRATVCRAVKASKERR